jgi:hypothetical protein
MMDRFKNAFEIKGDGLDGMKSWIGVFLIDWIDMLDNAVEWLTMLLDWLGGGFFALGAWGKIKKFFEKDLAWVRKLLGM